MSEAQRRERILAEGRVGMEGGFHGGSPSSCFRRLSTGRRQQKRRLHMSDGCKEHVCGIRVEALHMNGFHMADVKMWALMGAVCLCHCVTGQLLKGAPRLLCSVPGAPGPPGKLGPGGTPGADGNSGVPGRDGRDGRTGENGQKGDPGLKGRVGPTGKIGERGERGPTGKRGPVGENAGEGPPGPLGHNGEKGQKGQPGIRGMPGQCKCGSLTPKSAFSAGITNSYPTENTPIKFNKVLLNEGGHYNPQTGKFICAYPGIYYFSYDITLANKHLAIALMHNGQHRIKTFDANTGNHDVASGSTVMFLNAEDAVWLEIFYHDQNGLFADPGWADSLFSGFLLYVDTDYFDKLAADYA